VDENCLGYGSTQFVVPPPKLFEFGPPEWQKTGRAIHIDAYATRAYIVRGDHVPDGANTAKETSRTTTPGPALLVMMFRSRGF